MKLHTMISIAKLLLSHDDAPHAYTDEKGTLVIPPLREELNDQTAPRKRKILVYHEFPMMAHTLKSVCLSSYSSITGAY
jgi:hypothetical protein